MNPEMQTQTGIITIKTGTIEEMEDKEEIKDGKAEIEEETEETGAIEEETTGTTAIAIIAGAIMKAIMKDITQIIEIIIGIIEEELKNS